MKNRWKHGRLDDLTKADSPITYGVVKPGAPGDVLFIRGGDLANGRVLGNQLRTITSEVSEQYRRTLLRGGELLICLVGQPGQVAVAPPALAGANIARQVGLIRLRTEVDAEFISYFLQSPDGQASLGTHTGGSVQQVINLGDLRTVKVPVPPLPEQQRIVGILDEAFEGIATAKANSEKNLQNARALFESHLQSVFTHRGEGWVDTTLGEVCEFIGGSQPPKSVFSKTKKADNIRLIQIRDYKSDKHVVYIPRAQARRVCNADDVMIGRYGPPLFQILRGLEGAYNVALMKAVPDESKLSRDFLFYFLKHSTILQYVIYHSERAAGQIGLTKETIEPYPIALPSLADQQKVVETITELESESQRLANLYERKLAALKALKKSLLHQAFSGDL